MKFLICILFIHHSLNNFVYGKSCGQQAGDFMQCLSSVRENQAVTVMNAKIFKEEISTCFAKSGCQSPSLDDENFLLKKLGLQNNEIYSRFTKCTSNVLKSARTSVEKCAASKLAGLTLPPIAEVKDEPMKQPVINYWSAQIFVHSRNVTICPNRTEKLDACVADTIARAEFVEAKSSFNNFLKTEKTVDDFCNANCFSRILDDLSLQQFQDYRERFPDL
uniref:DUF19 domain-containing protein n=1 Tax=Romanomermis culicivorax TaxID=13658 RepID=A0A915KTB5_ROMCU